MSACAGHVQLKRTACLQVRGLGPSRRCWQGTSSIPTRLQIGGPNPRPGDVNLAINSLRGAPLTKDWKASILPHGVARATSGDVHMRLRQLRPLLACVLALVLAGCVQESVQDGTSTFTPTIGYFLYFGFPASILAAWMVYRRPKQFPDLRAKLRGGLIVLTLVNLFVMLLAWPGLRVTVNDEQFAVEMGLWYSPVIVNFPDAAPLRGACARSIRP